MASGRLVLPRPVRAKERKQTRAEAAEVYRHVERREGGKCLATVLDAAHVCEGAIERHHAGLRIGMAKITDVYHVTLLCHGANFGAWARVHDREVMAEIKRREDAVVCQEGVDRPGSWRRRGHGGRPGGVT